MDSNSAPLEKRLRDIYDEYSTCKACKLCAYRDKAFTGIGNPKSPVIFVVDRPHPLDIAYASFLRMPSAYTSILDAIFDYTGRDWREFWVTPATMCPPARVAPIGERPLESSPLPKPKEVIACAGRLHKEIHAIGPELVVMLGQSGMKALIPTDTPSIHYNFGEIHEGLVRGDYGMYPVPALLTSSLHMLLTTLKLDEGGLWNRTALHISKAIQIAEYLRGPDKEAK